MDLEATRKTNMEDMMKYQNTAEQQHYVLQMKCIFIVVYGLLLLDTTTFSQKKKYLVKIIHIDKEESHTDQLQPSVDI